MREVTAFIRVNVVDKVIQALEAAGISNITVIDVRAAPPITDQLGTPGPERPLNI